MRLITWLCVCNILYEYKLSSDGFDEFPLSQARFFFQQLVSGVSYCHSMVSRHSQNFVVVHFKTRAISSYVSYPTAANMS